jgi:SAM-dependent methyltransferase
LPFAEQSFDLVTMNQVLEHVSDQASVLREAARVVKAGGAIYIACPNYLRLYEPHYKIFWLPMLPKFMGRAYLRLRGRDPVMLDQLSYTTNARLRRLFSELGDEYQSVDLHARGFLAKCLRGSFARRWVRTAAKMMKLPLIGNVLQRAVLRFLALREGGSEFVIVRRHVRDTAC